MDLRSIARCCESNTLQRDEKCQFYAFRDVTTGADRAEYFMAPNSPEGHFDSNQICFYSGKVFPLAEFLAKLFLTRK